ncbi:MAG: DNA polymerase III subunit beta [Chloroflexi bacterium]|nr:DNA polymerase III subunit beta [Anaerolineaceae bacterium]NMB89510.1 DNA polymerase III subunit beta [Chloroflexota bacterium]
MKASVSQQQLAHGLSVVSRAVSPRSTLPVLSNVLVATDEGRLRLSATNLELGISSWIGAQIQEEGAITVPARTFSDLIGALPNDTVHLDLNSKTQTLNVRCGTSVTDIKGIDAQEFPPMPVPDLRDGIDLNVADFKEMIQQVAFAASTDEARPVLQGVLLKVDNEMVTMAATDGFRVSIRKATLSQSGVNPLNAIIPARALNELARVATDGEQSVTMIVPPGRGQVLFHLKDIELVSQLIDGNFPPYDAIVPRSCKTATILSTSGFLKACKQAEIIARDGNNVVRLNIQPGSDRPGQVEISAQSEETGSSEIGVDATVNGPNLVIAFNVRFLREVLDVIKSPSVALETNANNTPGVIRPVGDENFLHVIMPMHLG